MIVEYDFEVLMHLLPALVNEEWDHLNNEEFNQVAEFTSQFGDHWSPVYDDEFPEDFVQHMGKCDVTGLIGWCVQIQVC